jgi:RNA polymerase sigma factor (sigma-70 family)
MEDNLPARVRAGDPDAFSVLYDQHARAVYNLAFRLTGNWSAAEETVSLTFLEAWRVRAKVESASGTLRPWLLGITVNVTRNLNRATRRYEAALSRLPPLPVVPDFADELAGQLDDAAVLRKVRAVLSTLRPGEREVIALCVWSGLDYAAAALALGVPVGTVRSRLSRARRKLRRAMADGPGPPDGSDPPGRDPRDGGPPGADREPRPGCAQVESDRENAAQPAQEGTP